MSTYTSTEALYERFVTGRCAHNDEEYAEINTYLGTLWSSTCDYATCVDALVQQMQLQQIAGQMQLEFTRIEFVHWPNTLKRLQGAIIFDQNERAALHLVDILLGYEGCGPSRCKDVLEVLGTPPHLFDTINKSAMEARSHNQPYVIIAQKLDNEWLIERAF